MHIYIHINFELYKLFIICKSFKHIDIVWILSKPLSSLSR